MKQSYLSALREFKGPFPMWESPPPSLQLESDAIHLWRASLDLSSEDRASFAKILSHDETQRADRLLSPQRRDHFIAGRGILRQLVSLYTGDPPDRLRFVTGPNGKPALDPTMTGHDLTFNIAHSRGMAVYGFGRGLEIGIDLEQVRSDLDYDRMAARFYPSREWDALKRLPQDERIQAFFTLWTCKEAVIKAIGGSLFPWLSHIEVPVSRSFQPHHPPLSVFTSLRTQPWHVHVFKPRPDYCAALAVSTIPSCISYWLWSS